jgi:hypothetical protein
MGVLPAIKNIRVVWINVPNMRVPIPVTMLHIFGRPQIPAKGFPVFFRKWATRLEIIITLRGQVKIVTTIQEA